MSRRRDGARRVRRPAIVLLAALLVLRCESAQDVVPVELDALVPAFPYYSWFVEHTGFQPVAESFGAYTMLPVAGTLYLGFGAGLPAAADGALLAAVDDAGIRAVVALDEQGMLDMALADETLLIPGVDPCCPDGWEAGNFYAYHPAAGLTKWRNLPNVYHAWGVWYDVAAEAVYLATSAHRGDFATSIGEIWQSGDLGAHWERVASGEDGVGDYRTYDVHGHRGTLYAIGAESRDACALVSQPRAGTVWARVAPDHRVACFHRLASFGGALVAIDSSRATLLVVTSDGAVVARNLPFTVGPFSFNWAAEAGGNLYAIADDGQVLVSRDLVEWKTVTESGRQLIAICYWPARSRLVVAGRGVGAGVWILELCGGAPC